MKLVKLNYEKLLAAIGLSIENARHNAIRAIDKEMVKRNWEIGRHIDNLQQFL
jgi:hypothetical protein